jgi:multicomponent Na+:H+ antiporter subunit E
MKMRYVGLAIALFAFWLALSGHYTTFLVVSGAGCAVAATLAAMRMRTVDREGFPIELFARTLSYYPWLGWEIAKSAWNVARIIVSPRLPISPTITVVKASQRTNAGIATYANSITLTPGSITVGVSGNELTVHALTGAGADDLEGGGMNRRVCQFEGPA